jgi:hypothetical protein
MAEPRDRAALPCVKTSRFRLLSGSTPIGMLLPAPVLMTLVTVTILGVGLFFLSQNAGKTTDIRSKAADRKQCGADGYGSCQASCGGVILPGYKCAVGQICCAADMKGGVTLPGEGELLAQTAYLADNNTVLVQAIWRGNYGYTRNVPLENGAPVWSKAGGWGQPIAMTGLPGKGKFQTHVTIILPNKTMLQGYWRGNQGYSRTVPLDGNGNPVWSKATPWSGPLAITSLPGSGDMQSQTGFVLKNRTLVQGFWRGNQGYTRTFTLKADGSPDWNSGSWSGPIAIASLPGSGDIQSQEDEILPNGTLLQGFWRGGHGYARTVPLKDDGTPDWNNANPWGDPMTVAFPAGSLVGLPGSGPLQVQGGFPIRHNTAMLQSIWRANTGYVRTVPKRTDGNWDWNAATDWTEAAKIDSLPGEGDLETYSDFTMRNNSVMQSIWRGNKGYTRTVPFDADGNPVWSKASAWSNPIAISTLPGEGTIQTQADVVLPNGYLQQGFWRGNKGYARTVPPAGDGNFDWAHASAWSAPIAISTLPGRGTMQTQADVFQPNGLLLQGFWRGNQGYTRTVPMKADGFPDWARASTWSGPLVVVDR